MDVISNAENVVSDAVANAEEIILEATGAQTIWPAAACLLAFFSCMLFIWRIWSFTLRPWLNPKEPKELPYWFPCHAMNFFDNYDGLVSHGRAYFDDDAPFAISFPGRTYNVVVKPEDIADVYKNSTSLSWDYYLKELLLSFGVSKSALGKDLRNPGTHQNGHTKQPNGIKFEHKSLVSWTEDLYRQQFPPGLRYQKLSDAMLRLVDDALQWKKLPSRYTVNQERIPLMDFCGDILIQATTRSLLGDLIYEIEPKFTPMMIDFNEEAWKLLMFPYPQTVAPRLHNAKKGIHKALCKYVQSSPDSQTQLAWVIDEVLEAKEAAKLGDTDKASMIHTLLWIVNINAYRLSFWILSYVLFDPNLLANIRAEIKPAFGSNTVDFSYILERCPLLMSVFNETLRLTYGSVSVRRVMASTVIGGKTLQSGTSLVIPIRQLHYDDEAFGGDADEFDPQRFLKNDLDHSPSFLPFGERFNAFPRPFIAKREVLVFVALVLKRFEFEVAGNSSEEKAEPSPPQIDSICQTLGIMQPVKGTEVYISLKEAA